MLFSALSNYKFTFSRQDAIFGAAIVDECSFIGWHYSDLYLPELTTQREQNKDYSSNQCLSIKNIELQPKSSCGRYKYKLVVPR